MYHFTGSLIIGFANGVGVVLNMPIPIAVIISPIIIPLILRGSNEQLTNSNKLTHYEHNTNSIGKAYYQYPVKWYIESAFISVAIKHTMRCLLLK